MVEGLRLNDNSLLDTRYSFLIASFFGPHKPPELYFYVVGALIMGAVFIAALCAVPTRFRKPLIVAVTFIAGLFYSVEFFWHGNGEGGDNPLSAWITPMSDWVNVVFGFTLGLGIYNLLQIHGRAVIRRRRGWPNSAGFYVALIVMTAVAMTQKYRGDALSKSVYEILFTGALLSLNATMFSLVAFYIVSAAYRAFRIRSGEAALMMTAAFIVMLAQVPIGVFITHNLPMAGWASSFRIENIGYWILTQPNMAAQRGIAFGIAVGALAMSLRIWLSLERGSFFE